MKHEPAFPSNAEFKYIVNRQTNTECNTKTKHVNAGLTKREYFAAMAMQGLMGAKPSSLGHRIMVKDNNDFVSKAAVRFADALIKELERG